MLINQLRFGEKRGDRAALVGVLVALTTFGLPHRQTFLEHTDMYS